MMPFNPDTAKEPQHRANRDKNHEEDNEHQQQQPQQQQRHDQEQPQHQSPTLPSQRQQLTTTVTMGGQGQEQQIHGHHHHDHPLPAEAIPARGLNRAPGEAPPPPVQKEETDHDDTAEPADPPSAPFAENNFKAMLPSTDDFRCYEMDSDVDDGVAATAQGEFDDGDDSDTESVFADKEDADKEVGAEREEEKVFGTPPLVYYVPIQPQDGTVQHNRSLNFLDGSLVWDVRGPPPFLGAAARDDDESPPPSSIAVGQPPRGPLALAQFHPYLIDDGAEGAATDDFFGNSPRSLSFLSLHSIPPSSSLPATHAGKTNDGDDNESVFAEEDAAKKKKDTIEEQKEKVFSIPPLPFFLPKANSILAANGTPHQNRSLSFLDRDIPVPPPFLDDTAARDDDEIPPPATTTVVRLPRGPLALAQFLPVLNINNNSDEEAVAVADFILASPCSFSFSSDSISSLEKGFHLLLAATADAPPQRAVNDDEEDGDSSVFSSVAVCAKKKTWVSDGLQPPQYLHRHRPSSPSSATAVASPPPPFLDDNEE